jgi:hypothetical protein
MWIYIRKDGAKIVQSVSTVIVTTPPKVPLFDCPDDRPESFNADEPAPVLGSISP